MGGANLPWGRRVYLDARQMPTQHSGSCGPITSSDRNIGPTAFRVNDVFCIRAHAKGRLTDSGGKAYSAEPEGRTLGRGWK
jgi:hypothetical protein